MWISSFVGSLLYRRWNTAREVPAAADGVQGSLQIEEDAKKVFCPGRETLSERPLDRHDDHRSSPQARNTDMQWLPFRVSSDVINQP